MIEYSPYILSTIKSIPESCVFALISDSTMTCLVSHSSNLKSRIGSLIDSVPDDSRLVVFDVLEDLEYKLLLCEKRKFELGLCGYSIINSRQYINYRAKVRYSSRLHSAIVVVYNKRGDSRIVGVFSTIKEANEFVDEYYKQDVVFPVYSTNKGTKEMMEKERKGNKNGRI